MYKRQALGYGLTYMHTVSLFYILMGLLFVSNGMLRGSGDMGAFTLSSMANLFSRVAVAYALAYLTPLGANAIWLSLIHICFQILKEEGQLEHLYLGHQTGEVGRARHADVDRALLETLHHGGGVTQRGVKKGQRFDGSVGIGVCLLYTSRCV